MKLLTLILCFAFVESNVTACIWDADSLLREKFRSHDLAKTIMGQPSNPEDPQKLQERISELEANRKENDPNWWNNLAGAYLRLNRPEAAVKLLAPVIKKFPDDYGIHANLGTAYHLMGRYAEAEKEIARDLEINPDAHFGLEKYHLALLQYLDRDRKYQSRHVYVDEFTASFLDGSVRQYPNDRSERYYKSEATNFANLEEAEAAFEASTTNRNDPLRSQTLGDRLGPVAVLDAPPLYRAKWNLATDTNFEQGIIYMAQMNPKEPACFIMLGIDAWRKHDYHLAQRAFEKALALGSPQQELLSTRIAALKDYIHGSAYSPTSIASWLIMFVIAYYFYSRIRDWCRAKAVSAARF